MSFVGVAVTAGAGLAAGGASLIGAGMQADASKKAGDQQAAAAGEANKLQREMFQKQTEMYNQSRADQEPWRQAGVKALGDMGNADFQRDFTAADFTKDPGYDFRMAEGQRALERGAAARGGLQSGGAMKALSRYGQDYASNEYGNAYNRFNQDRDRRFGRLSTMSGYGQGANAANAQAGQAYGNAGQNYANNYGGNLRGAANAQGAAGIAGANAWGGAISGIGKSLGQIGGMAGGKIMGGGLYGGSGSSLNDIPMGYGDANPDA